MTLDPPVFLAPLAGITDLPFRELVAGFGAGLVVSEMIASQDLLNAKPGVREKAELGFGVEGTAIILVSLGVILAFYCMILQAREEREKLEYDT